MNLNALSVLLISCLYAIGVTPAQADSKIYFLRHAEVDFSLKHKPLTEAGRARAQRLVEVMKDKTVTHIFSTPYERTMDTATPLAKAKGLKVIRVPDYKIDSGKKAIKPLIKALQAITDGSSVVVVANSGNVLEVMSGLGVKGLSCKSKKCFPKKEFNNIWQVTVSSDGKTVQASKY